MLNELIEYKKSFFDFIKKDNLFNNDENLSKSFISKLNDVINKKYEKYILGIEPTFIISEKEFNLFVDEAEKEIINKEVNETLDNLLEKNLLQIGVNERGDIVYGLTELGNEVALRINKEKNGEL